MTTSIAKFAEAYTRRYGLALVPLKAKNKLPLYDDWGNNVITDPNAALQFYTENPSLNLGVALGPSRLCSFDVDDLEATKLIFDEFGWNLDNLIKDYPTIQGQPPGCRIMFRVPDGVTLPYHSLTWPKRDGARGRMTVWEIRSADDQQRQDVLPPSIHPDTGNPYVWITKPNGNFPEPPDFLIKIWENWDKLKPQFQAVCPWAEKPAPPKAKPIAASRDGGSVIQQFVAAHDLETTLVRYGYKKQGKRYLSPHSNTMLPGVNLFPSGDTCYIHHASDPLCSDETGKPVNAFDLFCEYEHGGDVSAAVKQAAEILGIKPERKKPAPRTQPAEMPNEPAPTPTPAPDVQAPVIFAGKPMQAAELFKSSLPEGGRIIFWRGEFYSWDGSRYVIRDKVYIEQRLYHWSAKCETWKVDLKTGDYEVVAFDPTAKKIGDFAHALRAVCYSDLPEPQCWIEQQPDDPPAGEIIAFRNGFLHWPTRTMLPSTDRLFVTSCLDFDYDEHSPAPTAWLTFLRALWPEDQQSIDALADMFGYLLTDDTSQQKMFMFIGPPRSGKGTILRVLESLIGYSNRVSPSLASIGTQFGLQPLIGKRVAMISDARLSGRADQQPIVENMLRISGEDALSIDRKNISAWTGKLPTRFVLASNELPAFSDASAALANRFILFKFTQSFLGREDMSLTSKLLTELPSIVLWALDGLERLKSRGYLLRPESANELAEDLIEQTSPIRSFVADKCVLHEDATCAKDELYVAWKSWCEDQGRDHPGTKVHFFRQLSAAFPSISRAQPRVSGTRLNLCQGIRIRGTYESGFDGEVKYF